MSYLKMNNAIKFPTIDRTGLSIVDKAANAIRRMFTPNDGLSWVTRKQHSKCFRFRIVSLSMGL
jgi:hypothetical protein